MEGGSSTNENFMMGGAMDEINDLLSTNKCSPFVVFLIMGAINLMSIYNSRTTLQKYNNQKYDQLFTTYMMYEIKFLILSAASIYGLCQYKQPQLAWILILMLLFYNLLKNMVVFLPIPGALSGAPNNSVPVGTNYGITPQMQQALLQQTAKQSLNKQLDLNALNSNANNMAPPLDASASTGDYAKF